MNILEQEDMVKGLPDQVLIDLYMRGQMPMPVQMYEGGELQVQNSAGQIPQYLIVSELDRRQRMRKNYAERVPEQSVTDQVISQGIAAMNPNPDPLMATAMGAQPPQDPMMGQDPMMAQMQDPMMQQQMMGQDPMMQQPPMDQQMMPPQDPMMMAAGGGMMPYRMQAGRGTPYLSGSSYDFGTPDEFEKIKERLMAKMNLSEAQADALIREGLLGDISSTELTAPTGPASPYNIGGAQSFGSSASKNDPLKLLNNPFATSLDPKTNELINASNPAGQPLSPILQEYVNLAEIGQSRLGIDSPTDYGQLIDTYRDEQAFKRDPTGRATLSPEYQDIVDEREALQTRLGTLPDYGGASRDESGQLILGEDGRPVYGGYMGEIIDLGERRQQEALERSSAFAGEFEDYKKELEGDIKEDSISTALIRFGAGIASGAADLGLRDASEAVDRIKSEGRKEIRGERRRSLLDQRQEERLGRAALQAAEDRTLGLTEQEITQKYEAGVRQAEFGLQTQEKIATEINRLISDSRSSEQFAITTYLQVQGLANDFASKGVAAQTSRAVTDRAIMNNVGEIVKEGLRKIKPTMERVELERAVKNITSYLMPMFKNISQTATGDPDDYKGLGFDPAKYNLDPRTGGFRMPSSDDVDVSSYHTLREVKR